MQPSVPLFLFENPLKKETRVHMSMMADTIRCTGHEGLVGDLCYRPDNNGGSLLLSAGRDSRAMLRDGEHGDWIRTFALPEETCPLTGCSLTTATALMAATSSPWKVKLWDVVTGRLLHIIQSQDVRTCAFSKNGHHLLTGGCDNTVRIFDLNNLDSQPEIFRKSNKIGEGSVATAAWLQNDQVILATSNFQRGVRLWDRKSGKIIHTFKTELPASSSEVNQGYITLAGSTVTILDEANFGLVRSCEMPCEVESASLYGSKFIAGGADGLVYLFDFRTGQKIGQFDMGSFEDVSCVRFSPDGKSFASGFLDGTIIIKKW